MTTIVGQVPVQEQLHDIIDAAMLRHELPGHILLVGAPGLGKSELASEIAKRLGVELHTTDAESVSKIKDMAIALAGNKGGVLFIDEIHGLPRKAQEKLYDAMTKRSIVVAGPGGTVTLQIEPFILVGATTNLARLAGPFKSRFDLVCEMSYYSDSELAEIISGGAVALGTSITQDVALALGKRSRGTPRCALRLLRRAWDAATLAHSASITDEHATAAMDREGIDDLGLSVFDLEVLRVIADTVDGNPIGLARIEARVGREAIDSVDFLTRMRLVESGDRGRSALKAGYRHLGWLVPPWCWR